jgi:hypothetical protein
MRRLTQTRLRAVIFRIIGGCIASLYLLQPAVIARVPAADSQVVAQAPIITVPSETRIQLVLMRAVLMRSAAVGDQIYAVTAFPVAISGQMGIPAGTYTQGSIDALTRPTWKSARAEFQMHFTKLVFANGYVVQLPPDGAASTAYVQVSFTSDILMDNGSPLELVLQNPLSLDSQQIAAAARVSKPPQFTQFKSASRCFPTSGTPGTSDTVIPGTSPTIIPGAPGFPDTIIPGTSPTIIPGTPGTSGTSCPAPPIVSSTSLSQGLHHGSFQVKNAFSLGGQKLPAGKYEVEWVGPGPMGWVDILQNGITVTRVQARIVTLGKKSPNSVVGLQTNPSGPDSVMSIQFKGNMLELFFN